MKVAVCESPAELRAGSAAWQELASRVRARQPDLLLLGELPFGPWLAGQPTFDPQQMLASRACHREGLDRLSELGCPLVLGTQPVAAGPHWINQAFVWRADSGFEAVHSKQYFPDEPGYYEARWFARGERHFRITQAGNACVGFLICTELMFNEHARDYGRRGTHLIAVPRAVGPTSFARWRVALRMAAVVSGCHVLSSNRGGRDAGGQAFGGRGCIVDPTGEVLAMTSEKSPVACADLDLSTVAEAQAGYPVYVSEDAEVAIEDRSRRG